MRLTRFDIPAEINTQRREISGFSETFLLAVMKKEEHVV